MQDVTKFRIGQRVRIREDIDSEFAGCHGVVVYVGENLCDVKIVNELSDVTETSIDTFSYEDLQSLQGVRTGE